MSTLYTFISRYGRKKPLLAGLVVLVLIFLSCAYISTEAQSETIAAEKLLGFHKKLQQVNDFEAVRFLPPRSTTEPPSHPAEEARRQLAAAARSQDAAIASIEDGDNLEYDHQQVHDSVQPPRPRLAQPLRWPAHNNVPIYLPNQQQQQGEQQQQGGGAPYVPEARLVHLDLKGAPPSVAYMKKIITLSRQLGATGVLLEYEDMFPWSGRLELTAHKAHYTLAEVKDFVQFCEGLGLEVIPLVQTFGHLEFLLKHEEFAHLRDVAEMPESICPCHNETMAVIREIVGQVMAVHPRARYLHIGCDEVYHLGECAPCQADMVGRNEIFLSHVSRVATHVRDTWNVTPIVWDDMLRNFMVEELRPLGGLVEPMVWVYAPDVARFAPSYTWDRFEQVFDNIWTASAFKGAHGETLVTPDIKKHLENNLNWLALMEEEEARTGRRFRGLVLTGWQRYDHFAVLCELLPAAVPSLAVTLLATSRGYFNDSLKSPLLKELSCPEQSQSRGRYGEKFFDLDYDRFLFQKLSWCYFPGQKFYKVTKDLMSTEETVDDFVKTVERKKGWMTDYNLRHNMTSPYRVDQVLEDWARMHHTVVSLMRQANTALLEMFDHYTAAEWIEQKIYPMFSKLSQIRRRADEVKRVKAWPSRPYPPLDTLTAMGIGLAQATTESRAPAPAPAPHWPSNGKYAEFKRKGAGVYYSERPRSRDLDNTAQKLNNHSNLGAGTSQLVRMSNNL